MYFISIFFWGHSGVTLWCDFQCLTSDYSHSFSLCSLKILQWFVRWPDEDGLPTSLLKQWSNMKDYIKDVSLPPTFLIVHFVVCFSRWMHACICTIWFLFPLHSKRIWLSHFVEQFSLNVFWLSFFSANLIHILCLLLFVLVTLTTTNVYFFLLFNHLFTSIFIHLWILVYFAL